MLEHSKKPFIPSVTSHHNKHNHLIALKARVQIGLYKKGLVVIKRIFKRSIDLKRNILKELNAVTKKASE